MSSLVKLQTLTLWSHFENRCLRRKRPDRTLLISKVFLCYLFCFEAFVFLSGWLHLHSWALSEGLFPAGTPGDNNNNSKPRFFLAFFLMTPQVSGATLHCSAQLHPIIAQSKLSDLANKDWECRANPQPSLCLWRFPSLGPVGGSARLGGGE